MGKELFFKCTKCGIVHEAKKVKENYFICSACGYYEQLYNDNRIKFLVDEASFEQENEELTFTDPIEFPGYREKFDIAMAKTKMKEAVVTGKAAICGEKIYIGVMDSRFMMGSMGIIVGEKITRLFEEACRDKTPVILFSASGGARMQEGIFSLMQMAKTASAVAQFHEAGGLFISFLTHPTTGGVSASFALLGDINLAEPKTMIGFAGKRVIEQTINESISKDFQTSEFLLEHGYLDAIVERENIRSEISQILKLHRCGYDYTAIEKFSRNDLEERAKENAEESAEENPVVLKAGETDSREAGDAWKQVLLSRNLKRFRALDIINHVFDAFIEFHGDRYCGDDKSMVCGIAFFKNIPVTIISQQKGRDNSEMKYRHYGMSMPEGYRKSLRLMKQAEKFGRPVICIIDTPGAFPGVSAEEHGQAEAIGKNLYEMAKLKVPVISIILGEGGSGGALALGVANKLIILENAIFSVVSPEGCASIIWKDVKKAPQVAQYLKLTATDLDSIGIVDGIISESGSFSEVCNRISQYIHRALAALSDKTQEELVTDRRQKYRNIDILYQKAK